MALITDVCQLMRQCMGGTGKSQKETCAEIGKNVKSVGGVLYKHRKGISGKTIELFDALGYDVEVRILPKEREGSGKMRRCGYVDGFFLMRRESGVKEEDLAAETGLYGKYSASYVAMHYPFPLTRYLRCANVMGYDVLLHKKGRPLHESIVVVNQRFLSEKPGK